MVSELNDLHRRFNDNRVEIKMTVRSRNNQDGFSLPINSILLIIIGVLTYFFGWIVIVFVLAAAGLITLGTYIHDKIVGVPGLVVHGKFGEDEDYRAYGLSRDGKICRSCKSPMFNVVHGQTRRSQIINFAKNSKAWSQHDSALSGRMQEGSYCPNGCVTIYPDFPEVDT